MEFLSNVIVHFTMYQKCCSPSIQCSLHTKHDLSLIAKDAPAVPPPPPHLFPLLRWGCDSLIDLLIY